MKTKTIVAVLVLCVLAVGAWYYFRKPSGVPAKADIYSQSGEVLRIEGDFMEVRYVTSDGVKTVGVDIPPGTPIYRLQGSERKPTSLRLIVPGDPIVIYAEDGVGAGGVTAKKLEVMAR